MSFVSYSFLALLAGVLLARLTIGRNSRDARYLRVLLVASLVFYGWHIPAYLLILLASTVVDYAAALVIGARDAGAPATARQRTALVASLATNLGLLAVFKYADFGLQSAQTFVSTLGWNVSWPTLNLVLPMGISFYTFQSMSYTVDVYRGRLAPLGSFWRFLLYVSFFPQLVAGPIVRGTEFLPQLRRRRGLHLHVVNEGLFLIVAGFFLKMVCADNLGPIVDEYWALGYEPGASSILLVWLALAFSAQIFSDFAGYTNIARGLGYLLGYRLPENFNSPYVAGSFKNFWERWHMTLSRWLRDYLYIPLGGNRRSPGRTYVNLMTVMVLGGLWHGAAFTFIAWGALHGAALAVERRLGLQHDRPRPWVVGVAWFLVVQVTVLITWVFFRSDSLGGALQFLGNIAAGNGGELRGEILWLPLLLMTPIALHHLWTWLTERRLVEPMGPLGKAILAGGMIFAIATCYGGSNAFIYFQF